MQKSSTTKGPPPLAFSKPNKKPHKTVKNLNSQINKKPSVKTSIQQKLRNTQQFLKPQKQVKLLAKSSQQIKQLSQKNLFKNSEIKKSIELLKNNIGRVVERSKQYEKSITSEQKYSRDAYYGNTTTSQTKSNKRSSKSKLSETSKQSSPHISMKPEKSQLKKHPQSTGIYTSRSPPGLQRKEKSSIKNKQHKRLKKIQQQYIKLLQDKLEKKQAELNTIKTRNMLQQTRGLGGWADGLREEEMRRLIKIHRTEEDICEKKIVEIKRQILKVCEKEDNEVFCFGGYECEDVLSFIQGKD